MQTDHPLLDWMTKGRRRAIRLLAVGSVVAVAGVLVACGEEDSGGSGDSGDSDDPIPVGAIFDESGPISVIGQPKAQATRLAIEDINANGGVLDRQLELISFDAASDTAQFPKYATELIEKNNVEVIEAGITSASREAMRPVIDRTETPYLYANLYEGGLCDKNVFLTGAVPSQQLAQLVPYAIENFGKTFYIAAADYNFGHWEAAWAQQYVEESGGEVVGTDFIPLENTEFGSVLNTIQSEKPDVIISLLVGGDQQSFYRQFAAAGLQDDFKIITPVFGDGQEQVLVGPEASTGIVIAYPYLQEIDTPANQEFVQRFKEEYGADATYINPSAMAAWNAWHLWAAAVEEAGTLERDKVTEALESGLSYDSPAGEVTLDPESHHVTQNVVLAEGTPTGEFKILETFEAVPPTYEQENCDLVENPEQNEQFIPGQ